MAPGILWAGTTPKNPSTLSDSNFNKWYDSIHLRDVLDSEVPDFALRYKQTNPSAAIQYTAIYHVPDLSAMENNPKFANIPKTHDLLGGSKDWREELKHDIRAYELIQIFEGPVNSERLKGKRSGCFVTVFMEPKQGTDEDFDNWYRMQHLDMISMCKGYVRTTRYKLLEGSAFNKREGEGLPRYLAIHEYETTEVPAEQLKVVTGTEWSRKVIGGARVFDRGVWAYVSEDSRVGSVPRL
jgi:hypothetical protein